MAKRKSLKHDPCPVARSLDVIGDRWSILIVRDALDGVRRFGEFRDHLGVAKNILSDRLRRLVEADVLEAVPAADGTAYQEYQLTAKGEALFPILVGLRQWGERHLYAPGESHSALVERRSGKAVAKMAPRDRDGRALGAADTFVKMPAATRGA